MHIAMRTLRLYEGINSPLGPILFTALCTAMNRLSYKAKNIPFQINGLKHSTVRMQMRQAAFSHSTIHRTLSVVLHCGACTCIFKKISKLEDLWL